MMRERRALWQRVLAGLSVFGWEVAVVAMVVAFAVATSVLVLAIN